MELWDGKKSISYSLAIGTFNKKQTQSLQGSLTQVTINRMGYNWKTPAAIVYGHDLN
jgi:hypothetical protein